MAVLVAARFSEQEMPKLYDPGKVQGLKPQDFIVVPRSGSEDIAFISGLEHKSVHQLKLRREAYPQVIRRASEQEVEQWWQRKAKERKALVLGKEKSRELKLDMKISHVRIDAKEGKAIYNFTSDNRVDFRQLVKELSAILKLRIELWQIGVRDEARMIDGYGVCGQQTCCSSWLTEFRPITIRMAKHQDIQLPPGKLSGQCGRLLCCLSYEVDQYKEMSRDAIPKGATVQYEDSDYVIVDRNLIARTYLLMDKNHSFKTVKAEQLLPELAKIPEQMKKFGKEIREFEEQSALTEDQKVEETEFPEPTINVLKDKAPVGASPIDLPAEEKEPKPKKEDEEKPRKKGRGKGKGPYRGGKKRSGGRGPRDRQDNRGGKPDGPGRNDKKEGAKAQGPDSAKQQNKEQKKDKGQGRRKKRRRGRSRPNNNPSS